MGICGSLWVIVVHFGSFWVVPCFSNYMYVPSIQVNNIPVLEDSLSNIINIPVPEEPVNNTDCNS